MAEYNSTQAERAEDLARLHSRVEADEHRGIDVGGEGHCQFYSLADQLARHGIHKTHRQVRADCCTQLRAHRYLQIGEQVGHAMGHNVDLGVLEGFIGTPADFDAYLERMSQDMWGDHITLYAAAARYKATIKVWSSQLTWTEPKLFTPLDAGIVPDKTLLLGHWHEWHYLSVEPPGA